MNFEIYVEEPSAEAAMFILMPRIIGADHSYRVYNLGDKSRLKRELPKRLQSYRGMAMDQIRIVALIDRDGDDCVALKAELEDMAAKAHLPTRANRSLNKVIPVMDTRIIIEELEAWFIGDVPALKAAYPKVPATLDKQAAFRNPDAVAGGTWEALERQLQKNGYHLGGLAKIKLARDVAPHMDPERNRSSSFRRFRDALRELAR
jgi:hypothetical protein